MKVVAKVLITNSEGKFLLLYRGMAHPNFPGHLDLPGGEIEPGEEWKDAVVREISEETALTTQTEKLTKVVEKEYPHVVHVLYTTRLLDKGSRINLSWEHTSYKWFDKEELLRVTLPPNVDLYYADVINYLKTAS